MAIIFSPSLSHLSSTPSPVDRSCRDEAHARRPRVRVGENAPVRAAAPPPSAPCVPTDRPPTSGHRRNLLFRHLGRRYKARFNWEHYTHVLPVGARLELPSETHACASVTSAFLQVRLPYPPLSVDALGRSRAGIQRGGDSHVTSRLGKWARNETSRNGGKGENGAPDDRRAPRAIRVTGRSLRLTARDRADASRHSPNPTPGGRCFPHAHRSRLRFSLDVHPNALFSLHRCSRLSTPPRCTANTAAATYSSCSR